MTYTLGSLFDGSGGFPLAGSLCGILPCWAAEVEPYPIAVTRSRFPKMLHFGDVSKINGAQIPPVDIITFGSPCQDLSIAGKRAGLKHETNGDEETTRSGLFMEAVRIIKEMRSATYGQYPKYAVWENVPGAFSSNKGEDFRIVLEELIKIVEPAAEMPPAPKSGWPYADAYLGDGWSLAYRTFDAQYWGVPQRRRRIYLVADFVGGRAPGILFEREGLRGYFETFRTERESTSAHAEGSVGADDYETDGGECAPCGDLHGGVNDSEGNCLTPWDVQSRRIFTVDGPWPALYGGEGGGHGYACIPFAQNQRNETRDLGDVAGALQAQPGMKQQTFVAVPYTLKIRSGCEGGGKGALIQEDKSATISTLNDQYLFQPVCYNGENITSPLNKTNPQPGDPCHTLGTDSRNYVVCAAGFKANQGAKAGGIGWQEECACSLNADRPGLEPTVCVKCYESHPQDSRVKELDEVSPTVSVKWHKGTADTPLVCVKTWDARGNGDGDTVNTITGDHENRVTDYTSLIVDPIPIHDQATRFSGKRGDKSDGKGNGLGVGSPGDPMNTLTSGDRHAVCYGTFAMQGFGDYKESNVASGVKARDYKDATDLMVEGTPIAIDRAFFNQGQNALYPPQFYTDGTVPTIVARGPSAVCVRYIVRRLTPTECARLQGFADQWGDIDHKEDFTDEEYSFWLNVRNTHAELNGKAVKEYTKDQMVKWYNKLHSDSAEYKMWGNGIALPPTLYVMQGITDTLNRKGATV